IQRTVAAFLALALTAGCATTSSRPVRSEFEDIPVPKGLTYQPDKSTIIESPTVKAARLVYRGRLEVNSLSVAMRTTLEANGWRHVSTPSAGDHGIVQVYEKSGNPLEVHRIDSWWFTYVELTASRALQQSTKKREALVGKSRGLRRPVSFQRCCADDTSNDAMLDVIDGLWRKAELRHEPTGLIRVGCVATLSTRRFV